MFKRKARSLSVPFVEAAHIGRKQRPTVIVLRTSWTTGDKGAALGIANAWHNPYNKFESCHYVVDEATVIQCVRERTAAFPIGTGIYKNSISIDVCYDPADGVEEAVFYRTADLVARLCKIYGIKPRVLNATQELNWLRRKWKSRGGILLKTVGDFPADVFLDSVLASSRLSNRKDIHV